MSQIFNDTVKQGYVRFKKRGGWQKRWLVLYKASSKGPCRLVRYLDNKFVASGKSEKVIDLTGIVEIQRLPSDIRRNAVAVVYSDKSSKTFYCETESDANSWVYALKVDVLGSSQNTNTVDLLRLGPNQKEAAERFNVCLLPSLNLAVRGECLMQVTQENIYLLDIHNPARRIVQWPLNALRRYGRDDTKFTFESGRSCDTGEGLFIFNTTEGEAIYQQVHSATIAIAEAHRLVNRPSKSLPIPIMQRSGRPDLHTSISNPGPVTEDNAPEPPPRPFVGAGSVPLTNTSSQTFPPKSPAQRTPSKPGDTQSVSRPTSSKSSNGSDDYIAPVPGPYNDKEYYTYLKMQADYQTNAHSAGELPEYLNTASLDAAGDDQSEYYCYEEKGLTPAFRGYLKERKKEDDG